jgi:pilus assembly protein Flp/PilA
MHNEMLSVIGSWARSCPHRLRRWLGELASQDGGQGLVEYALVLALVALVAIVALNVIGGRVTDVISTTARGVHP